MAEEGIILSFPEMLFYMMPKLDIKEENYRPILSIMKINGNILSKILADAQLLKIITYQGHVVFIFQDINISLISIYYKYILYKNNFANLIT